MITDVSTQMKRASLAETVYGSVRTAIVLGKYRPNERLVESELATVLGASRTPVREALQRLASEGLVIKGRQGFRVREFTLAEIREVYEVRIALEGCASRLAATRATDTQLDELDEIVHAHDRLLNGAPRVEVSQIIELNDRFHNGVIASGGNERLAALAETNRLYYFNTELAGLYTKDQLLASLKDHGWILESLRRHDGDMAEMLTRRHISTALELIEEKFA